ncbi:hypothetical protein DFH06DRAFT_1218212, partial [Mycena polygramma]
RGLCSTSVASAVWTRLRSPPAVADPRLAAIHNSAGDAVTAAPGVAAALCRAAGSRYEAVPSAPSQQRRVRDRRTEHATAAPADGLHGRGTAPCGPRMGLRNVAVGRVECGGIAAIAASLKQTATGQRGDGTGEEAGLLRGSLNRRCYDIGAD